MFQKFKNEAQVLNDLKKWLVQHQIPYKKNAPGFFSKAGESDLELYVNGKTFYVELKNRSKPTMAQIANLAQKRGMGYEAFLVTNENEMENLKQKILSEVQHGTNL